MFLSATSRLPALFTCSVFLYTSHSRCVLNKLDSFDVQPGTAALGQAMLQKVALLPGHPGLEANTALQNKQVVFFSQGKVVEWPTEGNVFARLCVMWVCAKESKKCGLAHNRLSPAVFFKDC